MVSRAHKIRLYPNKAQAVMLAKTAGTARYAYNWAIDVCESLYKAGEKHPSGYDVRKMWTANHPTWANEVASSCVYKSFLNVDAAYKAFFQGRHKHPRHHKKGVHDSFYVANDKGKVAGRKVRIPNVGYVRMAEPFRYKGARIMSYVVSHKAGNWYVSIQCEMPSEVRTQSTTVVGVDVGISNWAVASDGTICKTPGSLKHWERELKRKQRLLARKSKGSRRRQKAKLAVQKAYNKINNIKLDTIHKFTAAISKNHGVVVVEDLSVKDMQSSDIKGIRKGVNDSMMSEILRQLSYKCNRTITVDRYFPSSKTCSNCGSIKDDLTLSNRTYHCHSCGFTGDRDMNASVNLRNEGLKIISGGSHR